MNTQEKRTVEMNRNNPATEPSERALVITRDFDAPRSLVFQAWTDHEHVRRWWGAKGFTTPFCKIDLRPSGVFHYCMRSPEGRAFWGKGIYREIVEPERIVVTDFFSDEEGNPVPATHVPTCSRRFPTGISSSASRRSCAGISSMTGICFPT